jgi:hypothetical protein
MNIELSFEQREVIDARLNGLESVMAAAIDTLFCKDEAAREGFIARLAMLEAMMRQQNAHAEILQVVDRFRILVSEDVEEQECCVASV